VDGLGNFDGVSELEVERTVFTTDEGEYIYAASLGPAENAQYCPWNSQMWWDWGSYKGDCYVKFPTNKKAQCKLNLRYFGRCNGEMFDSIFEQQMGKNICKWQEALDILPMINRELMALGLTYEKEIGKECYNKKIHAGKISNLFG